jgi:hypothetical protein
MKAILSITLVLNCLLFYSQNKTSQDEISLIANVEKIDSLKYTYVIHIKHNSKKGIFTVEKLCENNNKNYNYKLSVNKSYLFRLKKRIYMVGNPPEASVEHEYVDDKLIWSSKTGIIFYENCLNMCGLKIDNEGRFKECK